MANPQLDVANSGLGSYAGRPMINGGITISTMPTGSNLGKLYESNPPFPPALFPDNLNAHYGSGTEHRFSHSLKLT